MENYYGLLAAILSPFFSSVSTIFKSEAAKDLSPLIVVSFGGIIGSIILFIIAKFRREKISNQLIKNNLKDISLLVVLRFIVGELTLTYGLANTSAIKAIFFTKIEPFFVLVLAWIFLKEKVKARYLLLLSIHLFGAILLSTGGLFLTPHVGDLLVIFAMFCFAASYISGERISHNLGSTFSSAIPMGIASLMLLPFAVFSSYSHLFNYSLKGWEFLFIYVVLFNVIALTLWFSSLRLVKGWIVSALRYVGPILGAPVAYFMFGQTLRSAQILGAGIIVITSLLIAREHFKKKVDPEISTG
jgi:drug/metabolite transporter (DMT)-like permease